MSKRVSRFLPFYNRSVAITAHCTHASRASLPKLCNSKRRIKPTYGPQRDGHKLFFLTEINRRTGHPRHWMYTDEKMIL
ncbi:hypothetical protein ACTXT7_007164 [Hymenolepis weldensis]